MVFNRTGRETEIREELAAGKFNANAGIWCLRRKQSLMRKRQNRAYRNNIEF